MRSPQLRRMQSAGQRCQRVPGSTPLNADEGVSGSPVLVHERTCSR